MKAKESIEHLSGGDMGIPNILSKIVDTRRRRLEAEKKQKPIAELMAEASYIDPPSFTCAILKEGLSVIAEVKKASPSKGIIKKEFSAMETALDYEQCADAISVLTEMDYFQGHPAYLKEIGQRVTLPLLRKDFIVDQYQIYEAKALGASCILLIAAILDVRMLNEYIHIAKALNMDSLVEVHSEKELEMALLAGATMIGINNRNLHTFEVNLSTTLELAPLIPDDRLVISESGIFSAEDIRRLKAVRMHGVLVGESLMRSECIKEKVKELKMAYAEE